MKVICVGRNYVEHIEELGNEKPGQPVIFLKPDTAVIKDNAPFYHPDFSIDIHHEVELVIRIGREGKSIDKAFAHKYYDEIGLGIDFTARDLQTNLKTKGLPWELAKAFNGSAPVSGFVPKTGHDLNDLSFSLSVNGEMRQTGNTKLMLFQIDELIAFVSRYFLLKKGDLIFTGTPKGVARVQVGDRLEGFIGEQKMFDFEVK